MYENKVEDILKAQSGNKEIMSKIIMDNSNLIWSIVSRFKDRGYEMQDLYQIGCIGFLKSIKRFDAKFEVKLSTYAVFQQLFCTLCDFCRHGWVCCRTQGHY